MRCVAALPEPAKPIRARRELTGIPGATNLADDELTLWLSRLEHRADADCLSDPATMAAHLAPTRFVRRPHLDAIAAAFVALFAGEVDRLVITTAPQIGKSFLASRWSPVWWLARRPHARIALASYSQSLAATHGRAARDLVKEFGPRVGGLVMESGTRSAADWSLTTAGGLRSVGVGGSLTGRSADLLIVDDPHKDRAEAESKITREAVHDWWSSVAVSRLAPGAPAILIATRWHAEDLIGYVLADEGREEDGGRWRVVHIPAVADPKFGPDPLGRRPGEPCPHPRIPAADVEAARKHWADKKRTSSPRDWAALYQGDPKPSEGALVSWETLAERRDYQPAAAPVRVAVAIDPSGGGRDTAGIVGGWLGADQRLYLTDDETMQGPVEKWTRAACLLAARIDAGTIFVETNFGAKLATHAIHTAWEALQREGKIKGDKPNVIGVTARKRKLIRAEPVAQMIGEDKIRLAASLPELENEWATWMPGPESPGRIDATCILAYALVSHGSATVHSPVGARIDRNGPYSFRPDYRGR